MRSRDINLLIYVGFLGLCFGLGLVAFHNVDPLTLPIQSERLNSNSYYELLRKAVSSWNDDFGAGFSNILNGYGEAQYASNYGGGFYIPEYTLKWLLSFTGYPEVSMLIVELMTLLAAIFSLSKILIGANLTVRAVISLMVLLVLLTSPIYELNISSGENFLLILGLLIFGYLYYLDLLSLKSYKTLNSFLLIIKLLVFWTLLISFGVQFFIALIVFIAFDLSIKLVSKPNKYIVTKALIVVATLIFLTVVIGYGYVTLPALLYPETGLFAYQVGRHDVPIANDIFKIVFLGVGFNEALRTDLLIAGLLLIYLLGGINMWSCVGKRDFLLNLLLPLVTFILLSKGSAAPFSTLNIFIHENLPGFKILGSSYPFLGLVHVFIVILFLNAANYLVLNIKSPSKLINTALIAISSLWVVLWIARGDIWKGDFGERIQGIEFPNEYRDFQKWAETHLVNERIYYFPDDQALISDNYNYSPKSKKPLGCCYWFPLDNVFTSPVRYSNYNPFSGLFRSVPLFGLNSGNLDDEQLCRILESTGTTHLLFDNYVSDKSFSYFRMNFIKEVVRDSPLFERVKKDVAQNLELYAAKNCKREKFRLRTNVTLISGGVPSLIDFLHSRPNKQNNEFFFSEHIQLDDVEELVRSGVNFNYFPALKNHSDLVLDLLTSKYEADVRLRKWTGTNWWTFTQSMQEGLIRHYGVLLKGKRPVISDQIGKPIHFEISRERSFSRELWMRVVTDRLAGVIEVDIEGEKRNINLKSNNTPKPMWIRIGTIKPRSTNTTIQVKHTGIGHVLIDTVIAIPEIKFEEAKENLEQRIKPSIMNSVLVKPNRSECNKGADSTLIEIKNGVFWVELNLGRYLTSAPINFGASCSNINTRAQLKESESSFIKSDTGDSKNGSVLIASGDTFKAIEIFQFKSSNKLDRFFISSENAYLAGLVEAKVYFSTDGKKWKRIGSIRTSDSDREIVELGGRDFKLEDFFIKLEHERKNDVPQKSWIKSIRFYGESGARSDPLKIQTRAVSLAKDTEDTLANHSAVKKISYYQTAHESYSVSLDGNGILFADIGYSKNWLLGNQVPLIGNSHYIAYKVDNHKAELILRRKDSSLYRFLILLSLSWIIFLIFVLTVVRCKRFTAT